MDGTVPDCGSIVGLMCSCLTDEGTISQIIYEFIIQTDNAIEDIRDFAVIFDRQNLDLVIPSETDVC